MYCTWYYLANHHSLWCLVRCSKISRPGEFSGQKKLKQWTDVDTPHQPDRARLARCIAHIAMQFARQFDANDTRRKDICTSTSTLIILLIYLYNSLLRWWTDEWEFRVRLGLASSYPMMLGAVLNRKRSLLTARHGGEKGVGISPPSSFSFFHPFCLPRGS